VQVVDCGTPNEPHRLRQEGPALLVEVRHPRSIHDPYPETLTFLGLIDTGSSHCCVDRTIVQSLGLNTPARPPSAALKATSQQTATSPISDSRSWTRRTS